MICKYCNDELFPMEFIACHDDPRKGFAWNLYQCEDHCGAICKEDVWNNKGQIWISEEGEVEITKVI